MYKCKDCGNTKSFEATITFCGVAEVDGEGKFVWLKKDGSEDPTVGIPEKCCICQSEEVERIKP